MADAICVRSSGRVFAICGRRSCRMSSREEILGSIRSHLAASVSHNPPESAVPVPASTEVPATTSVVDVFRQSVELVDAHCVLARDETEIAQIVTRIIAELGARRIAISDAALLDRLIHSPDTSD